MRLTGNTPKRSPDDATAGGGDTSAPPPANTAPVEKPDKGPKPVDDAKRAAANEAAAARRLLTKLKGAKSVDELWGAVDKLRGGKNEKTEEKRASAGPAGSEAQAAKLPEGWPTVQEIAGTLTLMRARWSGAEKSLAGTPFALPPREEKTIDLRVDDGKGGVEVVSTLVVIDPVENLAQGTAPLVAQMTRGASSSPFGLAAVTLGMYFGPALVGAGIGYGRAWWAARAEEKKKLEAQNAKPTEAAPA